jgi:hypothetical protein
VRVIASTSFVELTDTRHVVRFYALQIKGRQRIAGNRYTSGDSFGEIKASVAKL